MSNIGYIHSTETFGAVDGPGIRYVIFLQGCPLRCLYCHNPDSWKLKDGKKRSISELIKEIKPYMNYLKNGGVTLSGGEPMLQHEFCFKLVKKLKKMDIHVAIDTAGSIPLKFSQKIIDASDLLLLDIKALNQELCVNLTSAENSNTLKTLDYCEKIEKPVWIRHVIVPGYTLNMDYLEELAQYLEKYKCIQMIELIPFHKMGEFKWKMLNLDYKLYDVLEPTDEEMKKVKKIFIKHGHIVH